MAEIDDDRQGLAAEWVLGTLDADERAAVEARRRVDPAFDAMIRDHEGRLAPLLAAAPEVAPPADLEARLMSRFDAAFAAPAGAERGSGGDDGVVVALRRRLRVWQGATAAAAAIAAALVVFVAVELPRPGPKGSFVAVLQASGVEPAFVAAIDLDAGTVSVRRVGAEPRTDKAYELWAVGGGRAAPVSLGVVDATARIPVTRLGGLDRSQLDATALAISLEPPGGSPTGAPTGPVLWVGKLTPTE
jgi:anti-sigma-K factor RskA